MYSTECSALERSFPAALASSGAASPAALCSVRSCTRAEVTSYHPRVPSVRAGVLLCVLGTLLAASLGRASHAHAQDAPTSSQRVAVVLLPRGEASSDMTDSLTELLIAAIAARGATEIVGKEEFQAALGRDDVGTLACIESDACLGRMGRELRVVELVAGTLHRDPATPEHAERFRFELYRLDVENGAVRGRVAREIDGGFSELLSALTTSVNELYVEHVEPGAIFVETVPRDVSLTVDDIPLEPGPDGAFRRGFLVPGAHRLIARASGHDALSREIAIEPGTTLMLSLELAPHIESLTISVQTFALAGLGAALLGAAVGVGASSQSTPDRTLQMRESQSFYDAREVEALAANVLFAIGGASLLAAIVSLAIDLGTGSAEEAVEHARRGEIAWW